MYEQIDDFLGNPAHQLNAYIAAYMKRVPFENIDVQNGVPISTEMDDLFNKIVERGRGGYCYEMNTFFKNYLIDKGFHAYNVAATIRTPDGWTREGTHMSTLVEMDGQLYVSDVGFGDLPLQALPIHPEDVSVVIEDVNGKYRAVDKGDYFQVEKWDEDGFKVKYRAEYTPREIGFFADNLYYNQHDPNSIFVKKLVVTLPIEEGRVTMSEQHLTRTVNGEKHVQDVTKDNYRGLLKQYFNMDIPIKRLEEKA